MAAILRAAVLVGIASISPTLAVAQTANFQGLGFVTDYSFSAATGVSSDGKITVGFTSAHSSGDCSDNCQGFRWMDGVMTPLGLDLLHGNESFAAAVNQDGNAIAGEAHTSSSVHSEQGFYWLNGVTTAIPILADHSCAEASGISANGNVVVGTALTCFVGFNYQAFKWSPGEASATGLGFVSGFAGRSYANGVNANGQVIVGSSCDGGGSLCQAFRWDNSVKPGDYIPGLGIPSGYSRSDAIAVSGDGQVVVGVATNGASRQPFKWSNTTPTPLGMALGNGEADAVNEDGTIIVGSSDLGAFRWTAERGLELISDLLKSGGTSAQIAGWQLVGATGVSADGAVIVGTGVDPNGHRQAWIVHFSPCSPTLSTISATLCHYAELWNARKDLCLPDSRQPSPGVCLAPSNPGQSGGHDPHDYAVAFGSRIGGVSGDESAILSGISLFTNYMESYRTDLYVPGGASGVTVAHGIDFGQLSLPRPNNYPCKGDPSACAYKFFLDGTILPAGSQTIDWWAKTLASFHGLSGADAIQAMSQAQEMTKLAERFALFTSPQFISFESTIFTDRLTSARDNWNAATGSQPQGNDFYSIAPEMQALLFDLTYQHGGEYLKKAGNRLIADLKAADWCSAEIFLNKLSDGSDRLKGRLDLIQALKSQGSPSC
jgi:probable HAF family extracellular repeat protein